MVCIKERGLSSSAWNHNTLSLQYKLDNEFELIFVVAYQNILKLTYIDKFLTEIALRFRDKYKQAIVSCSYATDFGGFQADFDEILERCEHEAEKREADAPKPRKFEESAKASKTVASMIETKKTGGLLGSIVNTVAGGGASGPTAAEKKAEKKHQQHQAKLENGVKHDEANDKLSDAGQTNGVEMVFDDFEKKPVGKTMRKFEPKAKG